MLLELGSLQFNLLKASLSTWTIGPPSNKLITICVPPYPQKITESDDLILSPTRPRPSAFVKDDHGHYLLTAYFAKKPQHICKKKPQRQGEDTLVIQTSDVRLCGKPRFMEIPLEEKKLDTKWVQGQCFRNMGQNSQIRF